MGDRKARCRCKARRHADRHARRRRRSTAIFDESTSGDDVAWKVSITNRCRTLDFSGRSPATACPRNGHRPDGQLSVHGDAGVAPALSGVIRRD
jgi:hypothetical protein